jgi:hypothetical protein
MKNNEILFEDYKIVSEDIRELGKSQTHILNYGFLVFGALLVIKDSTDFVIYRYIPIGFYTVIFFALYIYRKRWSLITYRNYLISKINDENNIKIDSFKRNIADKKVDIGTYFQVFFYSIGIFISSLYCIKGSDRISHNILLLIYLILNLLSILLVFLTHKRMVPKMEKMFKSETI